MSRAARFARLLTSIFARKAATIRRELHRTRLGVEQLGDRIVPALRTWTGAVGTSFDTAGNWAGNAVPASGDDVVFAPRVVATLEDGSPVYDSVDSIGMHGPSSGAYNSVSISSSYTGTVTASSAFTTLALTLAGGNLAQASGAAIDISENFAWTGGGLGEAPTGPGNTLVPSNGTVNILGSGTITLPTAGTLFCGSTLNFTNPTANTNFQTVIGGLGSFYQNGGDGMYVGTSASVKVVVENNAENGMNSVSKTLTLDWGGKWGFVGTGSYNFGYRVINSGGKYYLGIDDATQQPASAGLGQVTLNMTSGDADNPCYTQAGNWLSPTTLQIENGSKLVTANSVQINGGQVWLVGNPDLAKAQQVAVIQGTYTMTGGSINFVAPNQATDGQEWGTFQVNGDVNWSGGEYRPGLDCKPGDPVNRANKWIISGTMSIDTTRELKPTITPTEQLGQAAANSQWTVIKVHPDSNGKIVGGTPTVAAGWTANADFAPNGTDKVAWNIKKN